MSKTAELNAVQDILNDLYNRAVEKGNSPETREWLGKNIDRLFAMLDTKGIGRPSDYNISIDGDGDIVVFFSQEYT